jgi:hypothetical protein
MELQRFVEVALARAGGAVQTTANGVDALLVPAAAASLEVGEEVRLRVGGDSRPGEILAGYGSAFLARLCALVESVPRKYRLELEPAPPKRERIEREADSVLAFHGATGRIESIQDAQLEYTLVDFRYAATSDEKSEGIVTVAVSAVGTSSPRLVRELPGFIERHPEARREWRGILDREAAWPLEPSLATANRVARAVVRAETRPFVSRMGRRLQRDLRRVHDYYGALLYEVENRKRRGSEAPEKVRAKLAAVEAEKRHRGQDLQRRYAVSLRLEPVAVLALRIRGSAAVVRLQRRKAATTLLLGWNGVARELDHWICTTCGAEAPSPVVCAAFHLVCAECPRRCETCGRDACPACAPACRCARAAGTA